MTDHFIWLTEFHPVISVLNLIACKWTRTFLSGCNQGKHWFSICGVLFSKSFFCAHIYSKIWEQNILKTVSGYHTVWTEKCVQNSHLTIRDYVEYYTSGKTAITWYSVLATKSLKLFVKEANLLSYSRFTLNLKITSLCHVSKWYVNAVVLIPLALWNTLNCISWDARDSLLM